MKKDFTVYKMTSLVVTGTIASSLFACAPDKTGWKTKLDVYATKSSPQESVPKDFSKKSSDTNLPEAQSNVDKTSSEKTSSVETSNEDKKNNDSSTSPTSSTKASEVTQTQTPVTAPATTTRTESKNKTKHSRPRAEVLTHPKEEIAPEKYSELEASKLFDFNGRPLFNFQDGLKKLFGEKLNNQTQSLESMSKDQQLKALQLYYSLRRITHTQMGADVSSLLESTKIENGLNADLILTTRIINQAYQYAKIDISEDFNNEKNNSYFPNQIDSTQKLVDSLILAGWAAWDASEFKSPIGAIILSGSDLSHIYFSSSDDGMLVLNSSYPTGVDLRKLSKKVLEENYMKAVFFLPKGINPNRYDAKQ